MGTCGIGTGTPKFVGTWVLTRRERRVSAKHEIPKTLS